MATTRKGSASRRVTPLSVTCRSSMHSSSADCVRGVARFISSASSMLVNTGPGLKVNSPALESHIDRPVTSVGSRSGVNCMRAKSASSERASDLASTVLPVPGTSSSSIWPRASIAHMTSFIASSLPTITRLTLSDTCFTNPATSFTSIWHVSRFLAYC